MATRMQQRRGTASQWTTENPILNAGELGWESDTNKFKIGDGTNHWADLDYFIDANSIANPAFGTSIVFEGATADSFETTIQVTDATADRTITFPDATGTVALTTDISVTAGSTNTLSNKSISLATNTVTGTKAEFNSAMSDADFATIAGAETLTNKTLTSPVITGAVFNDGSVVFEGTTANDFETTLTVADPTADRTITFPDATGTVALTSDIAAGVVTETGTQTLTNKTFTSPIITGAVFNDGSVVFEGATANEFETTLTVTDPTVDRTITFPDATGTVALTTDIVPAEVTASSTNTFTNKSVSLATNTVTGTTAEFNSALSDSNFVTTGDTGTVTSTMIVDGTIVNSDINASAAIAQSKIDGLTTDLSAKAPLADPTFTGTISAASLTLSGDLTVNGTTTNLNSTNLVIEDKNIVLGDTTTPTDTTADGGGITLKGATDKTLNWIDATDAWTSSEDFNLVTGKAYEIAGTSVLSATTLGSGVTGSSLTSVGTITSGTWTGTAIAVANGGTGSTSAEDARTALGLVIGTNVQAYNSTLAAVAGGNYTGDDSITTLGTISAGTWNGTTIAIANGGTGQTTAMAAATALLPSQTSNSGKYLTNDGSGTLSWATVAGYSAPTLGSTSIASGATVTTITGLTLSNATLSGTLTAGGGTGTSGQVLQSTGSGVQWVTAGAGADEMLVLMGAL
jgi:hypothetical protein